MRKNLSRKCFDNQKPVEEIQQCLENICSEIKPEHKWFSNDLCFIVTYEQTKLKVSKEKDGYFAGVEIPGYMFIVILLLSSALVSVVLNKIAVLGLVPGMLLYWIYAEFYNRSKKTVLDRFCEKVRGNQNIEKTKTMAQ